MITSINHMDNENRTTLCELILCDPFAGRLAREYLDYMHEIRGVTSEQSTLELIAWLVLAREAVGVAGVGHA